MTSGTLPEPAWELAGADHFRQWSGELEVFRVDLDRLDVEGLAGSALATSEERTRAGRFQRSDDRRRYLAARLSSRALAASRLQVAPGDVAFVRTEQGEPRLAEPSVDEPFEFNLTHAARWVLVALSAVGPVGIDVEPADRTDGSGGIAESVLRPAALERWRESSEEGRAAFFMHLWTAKEAALKGPGEGLYCDPADAACRFDGDCVTAVEFESDAGVEPREWQIHPFRVRGGAIGAFARAGRPSVEVRWYDATERLDELSAG